MSQAASITWPSTPRGSASCRQARQRDRRRRRPSGREIGRPDQQSERATGRRVYHRARLDRRGQRGRRVGAVSPRHQPQTSEDLALSDDVDNIRIDPTTGNIIVGYGNGALAIIDPQDGVEGRRHHAFWASRSLPGRAQDTPAPLSTCRMLIRLWWWTSMPKSRRRPGQHRASGPIFRWPSARQASRLPWSSAAPDARRSGRGDLGYHKDDRRVRRRGRSVLRREAKPVPRELRRRRDRYPQLRQRTLSEWPG